MISIIVPLHNSAATIERCMQSLDSAATTANVEVEAVFILDGPDEPTSEAIRAHTGSRLVRRLIHTQEHGGIAAARNRGLAVATQPLVTFLDADDELTPQRLLYAKTNSITGIAIGRQQLATPDRTPPGLHESAVRSNQIPYLTSLIASRQTINQLGGFEGAFTLGDDWDLVLRARRREIPIEFVAETWVLRHLDDRNASHDTRTLTSEYFAAIRTHLRESRSDKNNDEP